MKLESNDVIKIIRSVPGLEINKYFKVIEEDSNHFTLVLCTKNGKPFKKLCTIRKDFVENNIENIEIFRTNKPLNKPKTLSIDVDNLTDKEIRTTIIGFLWDLANMLNKNGDRSSKLSINYSRLMNDYKIDNITKLEHIGDIKIFYKDLLQIYYSSMM